MCAMGKTTIKDVAEAAGVSVGLVSMVLNNKKGVNKHTAERIFKIAEDLKYTPNKLATALRVGYNKTIGVITPDISNHFFSEISRFIENLGFDNGYTVIFGSSDDRGDKIEKLVDIFHSDGIQGLLLTPSDDSISAINRAKKYGMSVVLMNRNLEGIDGVGVVILDNEKAMKMGVGHFYRNGYRHIEMISNDVKLLNLKIREECYKKAMKDFGLEENVRIHYVDEHKSDELDRKIIEVYNSGADSLFVPRGYLALSVHSAIKRIGLRIPEDLGLIGFDGGNVYTMISPTITQLVQDTRTTAEKSYNMLCEMMEGGTPYEYLISPELIVGDSTSQK